jgi:hypothetical protein
MPLASYAFVVILQPVTSNGANALDRKRSPGCAWRSRVGRRERDTRSSPHVSQCEKCSQLGLSGSALARGGDHGQGPTRSERLRRRWRWHPPLGMRFPRRPSLGAMVIAGHRYGVRTARGMQPASCGCAVTSPLMIWSGRVVAETELTCRLPHLSACPACPDLRGQRLV